MTCVPPPNVARSVATTQRGPRHEMAHPRLSTSNNASPMPQIVLPTLSVAYRASSFGRGKWSAVIGRWRSLPRRWFVSGSRRRSARPTSRCLDSTRMSFPGLFHFRSWDAASFQKLATAQAASPYLSLRSVRFLLRAKDPRTRGNETVKDLPPPDYPLTCGRAGWDNYFTGPSGGQSPALGLGRHTSPWGVFDPGSGMSAHEDLRPPR